jgi:hypothetical protein
MIDWHRFLTGSATLAVVLALVGLAFVALVGIVEDQWRRRDLIAARLVLAGLAVGALVVLAYAFGTPA